MLTACSGSDNDGAATGNEQTTATGSQAATTTTAAANLSARQVEYFSEKYLPADERLKSRQGRIKAVLN